jgi:uncharacterized protein YkwD
MKNSYSHTVVSILLMIVFSAQGSLAKKTYRDQSPQKKTQTVKSEGSSLNSLLSKREQELLAEINLARSQPAQYRGYLVDFRQRYNGKELRFRDGPLLITNEGVAALDEALSFLSSVKPLPPLETRRGLVLAAKAHLDDMLRTGRSGHKGSDGSNAEDRFSRYGTWSDSVGEDIVYYSRTVREDIISLIIDDGVKNRGHRKNIFKPSFHVIGIALGPPVKSGTVCVITFAGGFIDNSAGEVKATTPKATKY